MKIYNLTIVKFQIHFYHNIKFSVKSLSDMKLVTVYVEKYTKLNLK